jgi:ketosteroid isomerase-like protein
MTAVNHGLVREFFAALSRGQLPDSLLTPDMTAWTTSSGAVEKLRYQAGVKLLASVASGGLAYTIDALTAEADRVAAEVKSHGTLIDGADFQNTYVFIFRIRDGLIASVAEHFNPIVVREKIVPLLQAAAAAAEKR